MANDDITGRAFAAIADQTADTIKKIQQTYVLDIAKLTDTDIFAIATVAEGGRRMKWSPQYTAHRIATEMKLKRKGHDNAEFGSDVEFLKWCRLNEKQPTKRQYSKYKRSREDG